MSRNSNLRTAEKNKNDEFYTQLFDINNELKHYKKHFKNKTIFLNCDDPRSSKFYVYFAQNFDHLGIKKLISTHWEEEGSTYKLEIINDNNNDGKINALDTIETPLKGNGDFRSEECIEILKEADIVITNPPFSLFREYMAQLIEYNKEFLIIGNSNSTLCKEIFPLIKYGKLWLGMTHPTKFLTPDQEEKAVPTSWYTNLSNNRINDKIPLFKTFNKEDYPKYDNYDAINVNKVADIPVDYFDVMGVPFSFLNKFNPDQFEIIGGLNRYDIETGATNETRGIFLNTVNNKKKFGRLLIKRK